MESFNSFTTASVSSFAQYIVRFGLNRLISVLVSVEIQVGICCAIDSSPITIGTDPDICNYQIQSIRKNLRQSGNRVPHSSTDKFFYLDPMNITLFQSYIRYKQSCIVHIHYQPNKRTNTGYDSNIGYIWRQHTKQQTH